MKANDYLTFVRELPKKFNEIGAMIPSSDALGRSITEPLSSARSRGPLTILEVGPGTGPITRQILRRMGPEDTLLICEVNECFLEQLKISLKNNPAYQKNRDRITFFLGPVQEITQHHPGLTFDVIVSSLPFSNFPPELVKEILALYQSMLKKEGSLSFIEYVGMRKLRTILSSPVKRQQAKRVDAIVDSVRQSARKKGREKSIIEFLNIPPAHIFHLYFEK